MDRHTILRTAFPGQDLEWPVQVVLNSVPLMYAEHDWRGMEASERSAAIEKLVRAERARGFDFARPPLMRITLVRAADAEYQFVWSAHHLVVDGWSVPIVVNEVFAFYLGLVRGEQVSLVPAQPYRDYIAWLQRQDDNRTERFWRDRLSAWQPTRRW